MLAGWAAIVGLVWLCLFQLSLAAGAPLGRMAWGGSHRVLPIPLRWASLASAALAGLGASVAAQISGLGPELWPAILLRPAMGALAALFAVSTVGNFASQSTIERAHGVPLALLLTLSCGALAIRGAVV